MAEWPAGAPHPLLLIAELTYRCPLHCPYCSNPTDIGAAKYTDELPAEDWQRVFREAADLGVLQLALTGGEPMARKEIVDLTQTATDAGLYSTLVTSALPFPKRRVEALHAAGLDHVQISFQHSDPALADEIGGTIAFDRKVKAAALSRELDFPLTVNCVLHRRNIDAVDSIIDMAVELGARRLELANTQYHGWATVNRDALMPTRAQLERGEAAVKAAREAPRREPRNPLGAARLLRGAAEAVHGRLGPGRGARAAERRRAALPGGGLDPRHRDRQRARQEPAGDLARVGHVQRLPRHRVDAGAVPLVPARPPARGPRRLPLPGAGADRRRGGDRPGLPVLARTTT